MNEQMELVWAVELVDNGVKRLLLDQTRHSTPEEAKDYAEHQMGIAWKELERRGAQVVQREIKVHPGDPTAPADDAE